jgi:hypothetical protein
MDSGWYGWDIGNYGTPPNRPQVPASYSTVVGVGGTSLTENSNGTRATEKVWDDDGNEDSADTTSVFGASGGGCSTLFSAPPWENAVPGYASLGCSTGMRSGVDIAAVADEFTGYDIYETTTSWCPPGSMDGNGNSCPSSDPGWQTYGGTSLSSPLVAAMWALAGGPGGVEYPALTLYGHLRTAPSQLYDVTTGGNGYCGTDSAAVCQTLAGGIPNTLFGIGPVDCRWDAGGTAVAAIGQCNAQAGFDGVSGVGTPNGTAPFQPLSPTAVIQSPGAITQGVAHSFSAAGSAVPFPGDSIAQYSWSWGDGTTTATSSPTVSHTYASPGAYTVTLTATDAYSTYNGGRTGHTSAPVTVTAAPIMRTLTVARAGAGTGTVTSSPAGISCGSTCSHAFANGTSVTLAAVAASGSSFAGWSGGGCSGTGACVVPLSADAIVTATFTIPPKPPAQQCSVPKVKGKTLGAAKSALRNAHCSLGKVTKAYSAKVKKGRVISQRPAPGTTMANGSKVKLTVSKGREPKKKK